MKGSICNSKLVGGLLLALVLLSSIAFAHTKLVRSHPRAKSTLKQAPKTVDLWFSQELQPGFNTIVVTDQTGKRVDRGDVIVSEGGAKAQISLGELSSGRYTVDWKVLSADQHTIRGKFTFTIALPQLAAPTEPSPPRPGAPDVQKVEPQEQPQQDSPQPTTAEAAEGVSFSLPLSSARWLSYLAMVTLFGGFAFRLFILSPAIRRAMGMNAEERSSALALSARRFVLLSWLSIAALIFAALAGLILQASAVFDVSLKQAVSPGLLYQVITKTSYGGAWLLQVGASGMLALITFRLGRDDRPALWWGGLIISATLLLAPSLSGHAAATVKEHRGAIAIDWLHLIASGAWVGGLFHLALTLPPVLIKLEGAQRILVLDCVIPRFTGLAVVSVALIVLTGIYNSWLHVESLSALRNTSYGEMLLVKLSLILPMLLLGAVNTFIIRPRVARLAETGEDGITPEHLKLERGFCHSVRAEALLGIAVLLAAAVLVFLPPAQQRQAVNEAKAAINLERE